MMKSVLLLMAACGGLLAATASEGGGMPFPPPNFSETSGEPGSHGTPGGFGAPDRGNAPARISGFGAPDRSDAPARPGGFGTPRGTRALRDGRAPQDGRDARPPRLVPPTRQQIALRMMVRQLLLQQYDLDQDQHLNEEERSALLRDAREAMQKQAADIARRFDQDGDGRLNAEERARMRKSLSCPPPAPGDSFSSHMAPPPQGETPPGRRAPRWHAMDRPARTVAFMAQQLIMAAYDANHNGQLDPDERARFAEDGKKLYDSREAALLSQYDTDGDGHLSDEELEAALHALLPPCPERRRGRQERGSAPAGRPHGCQEGRYTPGRPDRPQHSGMNPEGTPEEPPATGDFREGRNREQGFGRGRGARPHGNPPRPHGNPPPHRRALERMLDPHFDVDILLHLAHPEQEEAVQALPPAPTAAPTHTQASPSEAPTSQSGTSTAPLSPAPAA